MFTWFFNTFWDLSPIEDWVVATMDSLMKTVVTAPTKIVATFSALISLFNFMVTREPIEPFGDAVDLTGYSLVFEDEFDGNTLDMTNWYFRNNGKRSYGYYSGDTVYVKDGALHIEGKYLEDGSYGPGWYAAQVATVNHYTRGYFEARLICGNGPCYWSAFWLQSPYSASLESNGGLHGVELDICEAIGENSPYLSGKDAVLQCLHVNGGTGDTTDEVDTSGAIYFNGNNIYTEYNTYAVKWDEEYYTFYVNGKETLKTSWRDGTARTPDELILSICIPTYSFDSKLDRSFVSEMIVDYVRIYQETPVITTEWE